MRDSTGRSSATAATRQPRSGRKVSTRLRRRAHASMTDRTVVASWATRAPGMRRAAPLPSALARHQVSVAVVGRAYVAVADVGLTCFGVQTGGDEVAGGRLWRASWAVSGISSSPGSTRRPALAHAASALVEDSPAASARRVRRAHEREGHRPAEHQFRVARPVRSFARRARGGAPAIGTLRRPASLLASTRPPSSSQVARHGSHRRRSRRRASCSARASPLRGRGRTAVTATAPARPRGARSTSRRARPRAPRCGLVCPRTRERAVPSADRGR